MGAPVPPVEPPFSDTAEGTWYVASRSEHSAKPDLFADLIERMSPGPYVELFARRDRLGWDTWGNESLGTAEMVA
jgi:N6-adenosine-specific RNA methylase IME4